MTKIIKLKTVQNALILLECFLIKEQWGVRELAKKLELNPAVAHKILITFEEFGYVYKVPENNKYELGMKAWEFGLVVQEKLKLKTVVQPILDGLAQETKETIFLTKLDKKEALTIGMAEGPQSIKFSVKVGTRSPLHAGATSKVIMAYLSYEEQKELIAKGLKAFTPNTITDPDKLLSALSSIYETGWSYSVGEFDYETVGLAFPIFDARSKIMGSLSVAAPKYRFDYEVAMKYFSTMKNSAQKIQDKINRLSLL